MKNGQISFRYMRGVAAVEFALISFFFFTLVLGMVEMGRMLYVWNTVQEVTRRAAREAVVRNFNTDSDAVLREAMFRSGSSGTVYMPASPEITNAAIRITYLYGTDAAQTVSPAPADPADNLSACADASRTTSCIRYVRAEVCDASDCGLGVLYQPLIGFLLAAAGVDFVVRIPISPVVMPAESLGFFVS
jgi:hypothetical protein